MKIFPFGASILLVLLIGTSIFFFVHNVTESQNDASTSNSSQTQNLQQPILNNSQKLLSCPTPTATGCKITDKTKIGRAHV